MADQGSKAAMQTDINAKCTTNGAGENTGTRIRALFTNLLDTLYAAFGLARNVTFTPFVSLQAGTFPGAYRDTGFTVEGAPMYKLVGAAGDPDDGLNSIFRQTPTAWVISNATGLEMYNGTGADLLTATWTNTGDGALPLPSFVQIEADDVQAAVEEVAEEVAANKAALPIVIELRVGGDGTILASRNPTAAVITVDVSDGPGNYQIRTNIDTFSTSNTFATCATIDANYSIGQYVDGERKVVVVTNLILTGVATDVEFTIQIRTYPS